MRLVGGWGAYSFVACPSYSINDHAILSRRSMGLVGRGIYHKWYVRRMDAWFVEKAPSRPTGEH